MKVTAIIPAYNEEKLIGDVINNVKECSYIDKIYVVDDGSTDKTAEVSVDKGAEVIELDSNIGKGGAIQKGLESALENELIAFVDADLVGFKSSHLDKMIEPLLKDEDLMMTVGKFKGGRKATDLSQRLVPQISGQRVVRRAFLSTLPDLSNTKFGVDVAINNHARRNKIKMKEIILENVTHVMKEEKLGLKKGFLARLKMYNEIIRYLLRKKQ